MCWSSGQTDSTTFAGQKKTRVIGRSGMQSNETDPSVDQEMLLREMRHQVANSLQIVASILSLKARTVNSAEARLHLRDACNRVLAIAVIQRQLLVSGCSSTIQIDDYLSELSQRLAASLTAKVRLSVLVDGTAAIEANKAVGIGLVMTELIINAIKHAFPQKRRGRIIVAYKAARSDWSLSVSDNGVGLSNPSTNDDPFCGTGIVAALANELDARVSMKSRPTGTRVSLIHSAGVDPDANAVD